MRHTLVDYREIVTCKKNCQRYLADQKTLRDMQKAISII